MTVSDNHASWHRQSVNAPFNQMKVPKIFGLNSVSAKRQFGQMVFGQKTLNCRKAEVWSVSLLVGQRSMMSKVVSSIPRRGLFFKFVHKTYFYKRYNIFLNRRAHIRHLCRKTTVSRCHICLINTGIEKMNNIKIEIIILSKVKGNVGFPSIVYIF